MSTTSPSVVAVITGERGQREIVRPLAAVGVSCAVLDWEELRTQRGTAHVRFVPALWRIIHAHPGAAIFTDMSSVFLAAILVIAKLHRARVFLRLRGDPFAETRDQLRFHWQKGEWPQWLRAGVSWMLDRPLFAAVDRFVPVSKWVVRRLIIGDRSSVVRIPVAVENFTPRTAQAASPLRLLAVTNFNYPQKIAALGRFLDDYSSFLKANDFAVVIAGTGIAWASFRKRFEGRAEFPGFVSDVARLYTQHDVLLHFSDLDAFPYVVLEAQAAGLPVVVNRDCGMLEQVQDGATGFIIDLADGATVKQRLLSLKESVELRAQLGHAGRESIRTEYSLVRIGEDLQRALAAQDGW